MAQRLGLSLRTLQRRLADAGKSYQAIIDEVRASLALEFLEHTSLPVAEIAARTGFSEWRAFRQRRSQMDGQRAHPPSPPARRPAVTPAPGPPASPALHPQGRGGPGAPGGGQVQPGTPSPSRRPQGAGAAGEVPCGGAAASRSRALDRRARSGAWPRLRPTCRPACAARWDVDLQGSRIGLRRLPGRRWQPFHTGGPFVQRIAPSTSQRIEEGQVFVLRLNGPALNQRAGQHLDAQIDGLGERSADPAGGGRARPAC